MYICVQGLCCILLLLICFYLPYCHYYCQGGMLNNVTDMAVLRSTGKLPVSQSPSAPIMPFKEQHLKQLRAQCLVYLAFR